MKPYLEVQIKFENVEADSDTNDLITHVKRHEDIYAHATSAHVKIEKVEVLHCDDCGKSFIDKVQLLLHRAAHVTKSMKYAKYKDNGRVKPYKCPECEYEFVAKSTLEAHSVIHQPFPHICHCGVGYYKLEDLESHKKLVHDPAVKKVERKKPRAKGIIKTPKLKVKDKSSLNKPRHVNNGPKLKKKVIIRTHSPIPLDIEFKQIDKKRSQCPDCSKIFCSKNNAEIHYRTVHRGERPYVCDLCDKGFTQSGALRLHLLGHSGVKDYACTVCNKTFVSDHLRVRHERIHTGEKPYKCPYCEKAFADPSAIARHKRIHTGEKRYKCEHCPMAYTDTSSLHRHRKRHLNKQDFKCEKCDKKFLTKAERRKHISVVHNHERNFSCEHCNCKFSSKSNLETHIEIHHIDNKPLICHLCFKAFKIEKYLRKHVMVVHNRKRNHTCKICLRQFSDKSDLRQHMVFHTGVKKFECDHCSVKYYTKKLLKEHIVNKHICIKCKICKRNFTCMNSLKAHKLIKSEWCNICGKEFICKRALQSHYNRIHANENKRYECDYCGKVFKKYQTIKEHILCYHEKPKYV